jgi:hypothetical protein
MVHHCQTAAESLAPDTELRNCQSSLRCHDGTENLPETWLTCRRLGVATEDASDAAHESGLAAACTRCPKHIGYVCCKRNPNPFFLLRDLHPSWSYCQAHKAAEASPESAARPMTTVRSWALTTTVARLLMACTEHDSQRAELSGKGYARQATSWLGSTQVFRDQCSLTLAMAGRGREPCDQHSSKPLSAFSNWQRQCSRGAAAPPLSQPCCSSAYLAHPAGGQDVERQAY